jgi:hypothetical protein
LPKPLRRLRERRSGDLPIAPASSEVASFDHGRFRPASNLKKDRLGEALLALGRREEEFTRVSALMKGTASGASAGP